MTRTKGALGKKTREKLSKVQKDYNEAQKAKTEVEIPVEAIAVTA